jgi:hypothetical protein
MPEQVPARGNYLIEQMVKLGVDGEALKSKHREHNGRCCTCGGEKWPCSGYRIAEGVAEAQRQRNTPEPGENR